MLPVTYLRVCLFPLLFAAASSGRAITISDADHEGRAQFKISTANATYYYDKSGGGFSRMIDRDGRDWISFKKDPLKGGLTPAGAGYRGIPNMVYGKENPDAGAGHPGHDRCESQAFANDTIRTVSLSGRWEWTWRFTDENATLTVERTDPNWPYWFLYEGTAGGRWSPSTHYFGTSAGGPNRAQPHIREQLFGAWRWAYFGDDAAPRVLLATQIADDNVSDTFWYMGNTEANLAAPDGMVVFGFGRAKSGPQLRGPGQRFVIGFVEDAVAEAAAHTRVAAVAQRWLAAAEPIVRVSETTIHGDMECFKIETPHATYLFGKRGAGFASILDRDGRDWISYAPGNLSAGEYRGLPKSGQPVKYFHCGYGFDPHETENVFTSEVTLRDPGHVRIRSVTKNGDADGTWDFFPTHATFTLERIPGGYWFIYEGTPGGAVDAGDFVIRPRGHRTPLARPWAESLPWAAYGASESPHVLLFATHQVETEGATHVTWPHTPTPKEPAPLMTVFGFGRPAWDDPRQHQPLLTRLPAKFSLGFTTATDDAPLRALAEAMRR